MKLKILTRIGILFDSIKNLLLRILATIIIIGVLGSVVHNLLKLWDVENKYTGEYKNRIYFNENDTKAMNVYSIGQGEKTIVILSGFGIQSPILEYKALANRLSQNYRVAIVEYYGYGFSSVTSTQRSNSIIIEEVRKTLQMAGINGPYILMPHSISNLYAMEYSISYPEEVEAIVSLDGLFPTKIEPNSKEDDYLYNMSLNTRTAWVIEKIGFNRIMSYVYPSMYRLDKMTNELNYSNDDIELYRKFIANRFLSKNMMNEIKSLKDNIAHLDKYKYPSNLRVLNILSNETLEAKEYTNDLKKVIDGMITNPEIQKNVTIIGSHYLEIDNIDEIVKYTNSFLMQ